MWVDVLRVSHYASILHHNAIIIFDERKTSSLEEPIAKSFKKVWNMLVINILYFNLIILMLEISSSFLSSKIGSPLN